jgi:hypothetical protein
MKKCAHCNQLLPLDKFNNCVKSSDGKQGYCQECQREIRKERYYQNKDHEIQQRVDWGKANKNKCRDARQKWIEENPEKYKAIWKRTNKKYKEKVLLKVGKGAVKCVNCGCDKTEFLEINHKYGGGAKEYKHGNNNKSFYSKILSGERSIDDLELLCKPCNGLHYLELKYGKQPYTIIWEGAKDEQSIDI